MKKTTTVKFPIEVLKQLENDYPNFKNPARIRLMHKEYIEMKQLKVKMKKAGEMLYGKKSWGKKFVK